MTDVVESAENIRVPVKDGERWIKHVHCDGARFHVLWWDALGRHCFEKDCIYNKPKDNMQ